MRSLVSLASFILAVSASCPILADEPASAREEGLRLLAEGDKLADDGKTTEAEIRYQEAMEKLLPGLRKLPFRHAVERDVTPRAKIRDFLIDEIAEDQSPEEFRAEELALKAFGLIPADLDYKETILQVYTEEIGAFYDPKTHTMHLIDEPGPGRKPGLLEALLGRKPGFDKEETRTVIAHELTHALADQHYGLDQMLTSIEQNDDRELALSALIEGEATLVMIGAQLSDWKGEETARLPAEKLGAIFNFLGPMLRFSSGDSLRAAPPIISESMLFPYLRGLVFCAKLTNQGGWQALDDAYEKPPLSTEQILHPEKYETKPDAPTAIDLGDLKTGDGWKELGRNVLGELQTSILLRSQDGTEAAQGWDGDQYAVFEGPDGRLGLVWSSTWDTEDDAREFALAFIRYRADRLGIDAPRSDSLHARQDGATFAVARQGANVAVVEGFPEGTTTILIEKALHARKSEEGKPEGGL